MSEQGRMQYIEVEVDSEKYAVSIMDIHEIIKPPTLTIVPNSSDIILGVINLRGKIITIVSLRSVFGMPRLPISKQTRVIVVNMGDEMIGILVDRVNQVTRYSDIQAPPDHLQQAHKGLIAGIGQSNEGLVSILDLDLIFSELSNHEHV